MNNFKDNLLSGFKTFTDNLMNSLNLSDRDDKEIGEIRHFLEEALGDRVNLFILENLSSAGLEKYEKLITATEIDFAKVNELMVSDIENFKEKLTKDLSDFIKEAKGNFVK